jgi:hypothetical protein
MKYQVFVQYDYLKGSEFTDYAVDSGESINTIEDVYSVLHDADAPCKIYIDDKDATQDVLYKYFHIWQDEFDSEDDTPPLCFALFELLEEFMDIRNQEFIDDRFTNRERMFDYNHSRI